MKKFIMCFSLMIWCFYVTGQKPNIIIIAADDLGWGDVGFHDSEILTPNLDGLAKEGIELFNFYTTPICSPTRAGVMTGRYPERYGLRNNVIAPWIEFGVDTSEIFLPEYLNKAGYKHRAALGKWHLGHYQRRYLPLNRGFNYFYGHYNGAIDYFTHMREGELDWHYMEESNYEGGYSTDLLSEKATELIDSFSYEADEPFFIYLSYNAPHFPLQAKLEDLKEYGYQPDKSVIQVVDYDYGFYGRGNSKRQTYSAMVTRMDYGIGSILEALRKNNIEENTLILFFSDNGPERNVGSTGGLRGHKFLEWEGGVRVPAIIRWPNGFKGGWRCTQITGYIDILPTLLDIINFNNSINHVKIFDGISIFPVLSQSLSYINRDFYLGHGALLSGNEWKLIEKSPPESGRNNKSDLLYNIKRDPFEGYDLRETNDSIYTELKNRISKFHEISSDIEVPPYGQGRKDFVAPKQWLIND